MDHRLQTLQGSALLSTRAIALFALVIACVLGSWRASDLFTQPVEDWVPASPIEASLMGILEPVAGNGNIRLSVISDGSTGQSVLILLASEAAEAAPTLERLTTSLLLLSPEAGDQLIIEQSEFARGVAGRPDTAGWTELGLYAFLTGLLAWLGFRRSPEPVTLAARQEPSANERALPPAETREIFAAPAPRPLRQPDAEAAALVRKDPARTATILRSWMRDEGELA